MADDFARQVRWAFDDPRKVARALGLDKGAKPQAGGLIVCCPAHREKTPSCSITRGRDGTIRARCFGCDWSGDVLTLVAEVYGLSIGRDFREVCATAAGLAGRQDLAAAIRDESGLTSAPPVPPPRWDPPPPRDYPPLTEIEALWDEAGPVAYDQDTTRTLVSRRLDPVEVDGRRLARVIPKTSQAPSWARYGGKAWAETGHRLLLRMWDANGKLRSVRAWRVTDGDSPKRLPPAGHRASDLVLANRAGVAMLNGRRAARRVVVVEGEPDWMTHALVQSPDVVVLGVVSGSWGQAFADRIPARCEVTIRTHADEAGEKYADTIARTLGERCEVWRAA